MKRLILGLLLGLLLGWAVAPPAVMAQAARRIFGTDSNGAAVPIGSTGDALNVVCQ